MNSFDYSTLDDESLAELIFMSEDRMERAAAEELAARDSLLPLLAQVVGEKQSWLADLPEWWAVVHAAYILGQRGGEEVVLPLLTTLRWADAFDCDWVTEVLPAMLGRVGPPAMPGLTAVVRDASAGWSARDLAMQGLAAITLAHPDSYDHVFRIIGERFMDEGEDRLVRQLAGQILLDFRCANYRMALLKFAREELSHLELEAWPAAGFEPEEVDWVFHQRDPEVWHYQEDWMRFYDPAEVQRRQKRWSRERLNTSRRPRGRGGAGGGQLVHLPRTDHTPPAPNGPGDSED